MIRRVERDDWERLREVRLRALATDPDVFLRTAEEVRAYPDERWRERAQPSERSITFVHDRQGVFDGMVSAFIAADPDTVILAGIWVAPSRRGSGLARELVERVIEWSRSHGRSRVVLSVGGDNGRAIRLYTKFGFVETDEPPPLPYDPPSGSRFYTYTL